MHDLQVYAILLGICSASGASRGARGKFEMAKLEALVRQRHTVLRLVHGSVS